MLRDCLRQDGDVCQLKNVGVGSGIKASSINGKNKCAGVEGWRGGGADEAMQ